MKRFFRNLKTLAVVAMVGVASLAVSCSEAYDDSQIKADIEELKTRVEALEIKLGNEITALKALIDEKVADLNDAIDAVEGKIAILDYEANEDGSWTLTTKDGEDITIYPQYQENNEGLLTVIEEGGVYYWAQIVNGQAAYLTDRDGNKYVAHHATVMPEIPEGHAEPQVRQDENGHNEVSFDGGINWYKMGGGDIGLFQSVTVSEDGQSLTFVLNNGDTFTTTLPEEFKVSIKSGKLFLKAEESRTVDMELQAIKDCEVLAKPEGWKATIDGKKLTIVAPAKGVGEESGVVKVLAVTGEGKVAFAKLYVSAGAGYFVEIKEVEQEVYDPEADDVVMKPVLSVVVTNQLINEIDDYGMIYRVVPSLYVGFMPAEEYSAEGVVDGLANYMYPYNTIQTEQVLLEEGQNESVQVFPIEYLYLSPYGEPLAIEAGVEYVAWVSPYEAGATYWDPNVLYPEDFVYTTYVERWAEVEVVKTTAFDITIDVTVAGYDKYIVYLNELEYAEYWEQELFEYWQKYGYDFGFERTEKKFSGSLFEFGYDVNGWSDMLEGLPNRDYLLLVLPLVDGKAPADYTVDDVKDYILSTSALQAGGEVKTTITAAEIGYNNVKGQFDAEGATVVYYNYYRQAAWTDEMASWTDDAWAKALSTGGYVKKSTSFTYNLSGINQGETIRFAAVAVDANGKYGPVAVETFVSNKLEFSDAIAVTASYEYENNGKDIKVTFSTTKGEAVKYRYNFITNSYSWDSTYGGSFEEAGRTIATTNQTYYYKETTENTASNTGMSYGSTYWFVVIAYDAEGNVSHPYGFEFTPSMPGEIVYADEAGWETGKPAIELVSCTLDEESTSNPAWNTYTVKIKVTPGEGAVETYFMRMDEEYEDSYSTEWALLQYCVSHYYPSYPTTYVSYGYTQKVTEATEYEVISGSIYNTLHFYMTWSTVGEDGKTYWHECWKLNAREFAGLELIPEE